MYQSGSSRSSVVGILLALTLSAGCSLHGNISQGQLKSADTEKVSITGLSLGAIPAGLSQTPTLNINSASSSSQSEVPLQYRVINFHGTAISDWRDYSNGNALSGLSLTNNQIYYFEVRGKHLSGAYSTPVRSGGWVPESDNCKEQRLTNEPFANSDTSVDGLTEPTAFEICTPWQLNQIGQDTAHYDKYFKLKANLDMSLLDETYRIIGDATNRFTGTLDGENRAISNLVINESTRDNVGLIGYTDTPSEIKNIRLESASVTGLNAVGIIAGKARSTWIENVSSSGSSTGQLLVGGAIGVGEIVRQFVNSSSSATVTGTNHVGGIVGNLTQFPLGEVKFLSATGDVTGVEGVGGLIGNGTLLELSQSHATGNVSGKSYCGGLIGQALSSGVMRVYATGQVGCTDDSIGGLLGFWWGNSPGKLEDSYATGNVSGTIRVGGLIGHLNTYANAHTFQHLYASGNVVGVSEVGGLVGHAELMSGTGEISLTRVFATGTVTGASPDGHVGHLLGRQTSTTLRSNYYALPGTCINMSGACYTSGTGIDLSATPNYFFTPTNPPLSNALWDFTITWQSNAGALPTLR